MRQLLQLLHVLPALFLATGCRENPRPAAPTAEPPPPSTRALTAAASSAPVAAPPGGFDAEERAASAAIDAAALAARTRFLADDALEGRAPGTRGSELATKFIANVMEADGLLPGADDGKSWYQRVPLVAIEPKAPRTATFTTPKGPLNVTLPDDLVVMSGVQRKDVALPPSEVVFVGYGIVAPELGWDDYKDVDVRGKVVVVMNSDPETELFGGKTRLWYGRWDYKYLQAAKKGAAGALLIHTTPSAGYPWQVVVASNGSRRLELPETNEPRLLAKMWLSESAAKKLATSGGEDLDALRADAEKKEFRPRPLKARFGITLTNTLRTFESANVIGVLPGADPALSAEAVVYTAHHDHFGIGAPKNGDAIYNGAVDNASGVSALLAIAHASAKAPRTKRSLVFVAVTAEEQGLLGSQWYCEHPTFAPGRIAANLNLDAMNVHGKTSDVAFIGLGKSSLDAVITDVARAQGRAVHGDTFPDRGAFYRSDQFNFAKIGVPPIYLRGGPTFVGHPAEYAREVQETYERTRYHQPSDEFDPTWDWSGAIQDAELVLVAGRRIANAPELPTWKPGDEFAKVVRAR